MKKKVFSSVEHTNLGLGSLGKGVRKRSWRKPQKILRKLPSILEGFLISFLALLCLIVDVKGRDYSNYLDQTREHQKCKEFDSKSNKCLECLKGYFTEPGESKCARCKPSCLSCTHKGCLECKIGFYLSKPSKCLKCPKNCVICLNKRTCEECKPGFTLNYDGECLQIFEDWEEKRACILGLGILAMSLVCIFAKDRIQSIFAMNTTEFDADEDGLRSGEGGADGAEDHDLEDLDYVDVEITKSIELASSAKYKVPKVEKYDDEGNVVRNRG